MFNNMTDVELLKYCRKNFTQYSVCKALGCEEDCIDEDCPLTQLFKRFEEKIN